MFISHPQLTEPDDNQKLWRYMDFSKFLAILETKSLHMAALTSFSDPFEGYPPQTVIERFTSQSPELNADPEERSRRTNDLASFLQGRKHIFASCWHLNAKESAGMWQQYLRSGEGIAIQTTFGQLKKAIINDPTHTYGGKVRYEDFQTFTPEDTNLLIWGTLKREGFEHEKEFRLLTLLNNEKQDKGIPIQIDPEVLIENIFVAPTTADWVLNLVRSILRRYDYQIDPIRSELDTPPQYIKGLS